MNGIKIVRLMFILPERDINKKASKSSSKPQDKNENVWWKILVCKTHCIFVLFSVRDSCIIACHDFLIKRLQRVSSVNDIQNRFRAGFM